MSKPEIEDCACGNDHDVMPTDTEGGVTYELVCRYHKSHIPCRRCFYGYVEMRELRID